jgi:hypothetical protein
MRLHLLAGASVSAHLSLQQLVPLTQMLAMQIDPSPSPRMVPQVTTYSSFFLLISDEIVVSSVPGFFCMGNATNLLGLPSIGGATSILMLMHDFHDRSSELK